METYLASCVDEQVGEIGGLVRNIRRLIIIEGRLVRESLPNFDYQKMWFLYRDIKYLKHVEGSQFVEVCN